MNLLKVSSLLFLCCCLSVSGELNISGTVINWDSTAIPGATVKLANLNLQTTTDGEGKFIFNNLAISSSNANRHLLPKLELNGSQLRFSIVDINAFVTIDLFTIQGKKLQTIFNQQMNIGTYQISLFSRTQNQFAPGLYVIKLKIGNDSYSFKQIFQNNGSKRPMQNGNQNSNLINLKKTQNQPDSLKDTLIVSKSGYDTTKTFVSLYNQVANNIILYTKPVITTNTKVVSSNIGQNLLAIDSITLTFSTNDTVNSYKVGDVLVSDMNTKAPYGYLRKIVSVQSSQAANQVVFTTEDASLEDVFVSGHGSFNKTFSDGDIIGIDTTTDSTLGLKKKAASMGSFKFTYTNTVYQNGTDKVTLGGSIDLEPSINFDIHFTGGKIDRLLLYLSAINNTSIGLTCSGNIGSLSNQIPLKTFKLAPYTIWIDGVPIPIAQQWIVLVLGIDGSISAKLEAGVTNTFTCASGIQWSSSQWKPLATWSNTFTPSAPTFTGEVSVEPWVQCRYELRPFAFKTSRMSVGIKGSLKAGATLQVQTVKPDTLFWNLQFGAKAAATAQAVIFGKSILNYDNEFYNNYWPISNGKIPIGPGPGIKVYGDFALTDSAYEGDADWAAIANTLTNGKYRVADWNDLKNYYASVGESGLIAFMDFYGIVNVGLPGNVHVTNGGNQYWQNGRTYFFSRHDHVLPDGYLAHDNIDNYLITLGSFFNKLPILLITN